MAMRRRPGGVTRGTTVEVRHRSDPAPDAAATSAAPETARGRHRVPRPRATLGGRAGSARAIPSTLDVRGARVDEVIELLDQTLDQAAWRAPGA